MRILRIFHPEPLKDRHEVELSPASIKHLTTVLRLKAGAPLVLFDGSGFEFEAMLDAMGKKRAVARITSMHGPAVESPLHVTLAQGISRGERMDYTVQKSVELGIAEIVPVMTERSVVRLDVKTAVRKQQHWQQVVISACEQSGRVRVPQVQPPISLHTFLAAIHQAELKLLLDPQADKQVSNLSRPTNNRVLLLVGPEGGLDDVERAVAKRAGFLGMQLGPRILRTETAALVAISLLQARWGDLGGV
ncbi:MAG TPA: 16S rRNA (uracil(1498)-N(3))-methyltransferase [Gammaproteobacteria bacterium]|nr:16S rRNA (uracil(1498)-N(3))-methyltransferase [Gammaproteobacteria bacterium]